VAMIHDAYRRHPRIWKSCEAVRAPSPSGAPNE
jgi:hypothetical protein